MKSKITKKLALLLALIVTLSAVTMTSCSFRGMFGSDIFSDGDSIFGDSSSTDKNDPVNKNDSEQSIPSQNQSFGDIIINGSGASNVAFAASAGLRSAVSVYCTFETTSGGTSFWNPYPTTQTYYTTGSGVIYKLDQSGNAFIITNYHVVYDSYSNTENHISDKIFLYLYGLESEDYAIPATYVGGSANYDIAILEVKESDVLKTAAAAGSAAPVTVANSDLLTPGQTTIAIGNPSSTEMNGISVTMGIVSVESEYITMTASDNSGEVSFRVIRTDTAVNSGNSGGGLFNDKGELIGIVNAKVSSSNIENVGYAIPSNVARAIADNIIDYCHNKDCESVMRGLLGITVTTTAYATRYDVETGLFTRLEEVSVYEITKGGIGEKILKANDIIKSITKSYCIISIGYFY